jgi:hypothetical protein
MNISQQYWAIQDRRTKQLVTVMSPPGVLLRCSRADARDNLNQFYPYGSHRVVRVNVTITCEG